MVTNELTKPRRIELILRQIDSLPTLPAIATRLLALTSDENAEVREVISLISSDPALTAKVLALCKTADRGLRQEVMNVDKAVVLLGFNAIRNAVLSVKVYELFRPDPDDVPGDVTRRDNMLRPSIEPVDREEAERFDRAAFWTHSLAVACLAELIARGSSAHQDLNPDEAFVCGLLHDVGKLALDHVLPKSFARVVELADLNQGNIAEFERRIVGIDHHTAGKRLAEQWQLPHALQDCIWLHGSPYDTLPNIEHRRLVGLVALADVIVRRQHLGYSGNFTFKEEEITLAGKLGIDPDVVADAIEGLHDTLESRGKALGINDTPSKELFLDAIQRANIALGRLNHALDLRGRTAAIQSRILEGITTFHAQAGPGRSVQDMLDSVVESASTVFGPGFFAMLYPEPGHAHGHATWLVSQYTDEGAPLHSQYAEAPPHTPDLSQFDASQPMGVNLMGILPWVADYLVNAEDVRDVRLLPLSCGWGTVAVLLHDRQQLPNWSMLQSLVHTWGAAIGAAAQHDGARRLGEELAESNSALAEAQDRLLRQESMARLGEMAAGAAHEMNNPLAVISGRSQLLSMTLTPGSKEQQAAQTIFKEAHRLSDLITCLHMFADPPRANRRPVNLLSLLDATIKAARGAQRNRDQVVPIYLQVKEDLPSLEVDPEQLQQAVSELVHNAIQASPKDSVSVQARVVSAEHLLLIQVVDDGDGMDQHTLDHAMDPFFSDKPAGRRVGMGLPRAQQLALAHGGRLDLRSTPGEGTVATLTIPLEPAA